MIKEAIATGTTIEDAKNAALLELNAPGDVEVTTEVLSLPVKKTFGLFGGAPAKVRAFYEEAEALDAAGYLKMMLDGMLVKDAKVKTEESEGALTLTVECEDYGIIIGRRGETLDSIQYLVSLLVNRGKEDYTRVTINVGDYRQKREDTLRAVARRNAQAVVRTGRRVTLDPMNPYERRIIHTTVQEVEGANSRSIGSNAERRVVIELAEGFKPTGGYGRDNNRGPRGGYNRDRGPRRVDDGREPVQRSSAPAASKKEDKQETPLYGKIEIKK